MATERAFVNGLQRRSGRLYWRCANGRGPSWNTKLERPEMPISIRVYPLGVQEEVESLAHLPFVVDSVHGVISMLTRIRAPWVLSR